MNHFIAAPPVPSSYSRLTALSEEEITQARHYGYVANEVDPSALVGRPCSDPLLCTLEMTDHGNDIQAWRTRMYLIWFCYLFENFDAIRRPLFAIEELFLHFQTNMLDDLAQMYAGAGAWDRDPLADIPRLKFGLHRYYITAIHLLEQPR